MVAGKAAVICWRVRDRKKGRKTKREAAWKDKELAA